MDIFHGHEWETLIRANVYPPRWLVVRDNVAAAPRWAAPPASGIEAGLDEDFSDIAFAHASALLDRGRHFLMRPPALRGLPLRRLATPPPEAHGGGLWFVRPDDPRTIPIAVPQVAYDVFAQANDQAIGMGWNNSSYVLIARGHLLIAVLDAFPGFGARFPESE